jgi:spore coat protein A
MNPVTAATLDRRSLLRNTFAAAAASAFFSFSSKSAAPAALPMPIDTSTLAKYIDPLPLPAVVRPNAKTPTTITMTQFQTRLHSGLPMTTVWGYNGSYPGVTIEAQSGVATRVRFTNALPQKHLLPIDPTLTAAFDYMLNTPNPEVRTITHLHGGHSRTGTRRLSGTLVRSPAAAATTSMTTISPPRLSGTMTTPWAPPA